MLRSYKGNRVGSDQRKGFPMNNNGVSDEPNCLWFHHCAKGFLMKKCCWVTEGDPKYGSTSLKIILYV